MSELCRARFNLGLYKLLCPVSDLYLTQYGSIARSLLLSSSEADSLSYTGQPVILRPELPPAGLTALPKIHPRPADPAAALYHQMLFRNPCISPVLQGGSLGSQLCH